MGDFTIKHISTYEVDGHTFTSRDEAELHIAKMQLIDALVKGFGYNISLNFISWMAIPLNDRLLRTYLAAFAKVGPPPASAVYKGEDR